MKILVVTAWYAPFIHPRAHRWRAICAQWAQEGHEVHVLTARLEEARESGFLEGVWVHRVGYDSLKEWVYAQVGGLSKRGRVGQLPQKQGLAIRCLEWMYTRIWKGLFFPDDACIWYFPAKRKMRQMLENQSFDAVITVSLPFTGHLLGYQCLRRNPRQKQSKPIWLADVGDPFSFQAKAPNNAFLYGKLNQKLEKKILESADVVSVTTAATMAKYKSLLGSQITEQMSVIPPLFEEPLGDSTIFLPPPASGKLRIGYFGALYAPTRTPERFLDILALLRAHYPNIVARVEFHFFGEVNAAFQRDLEAIPEIRLHGLCSRATAWSAMNAMDVLLNLGNTTDFQLPSKVVDYWARGKPIMSISAVENDLFEQFLTGKAAFFAIKPAKAGLSTQALRAAMIWLIQQKSNQTIESIRPNMSAYQVAQIARGYQDLIVAKTAQSATHKSE